MTEENRKITWAAFVESAAADFFIEHKIEKMIIEDGNGNKARLTRQKDNSIKVESTSTAML